MPYIAVRGLQILQIQATFLTGAPCSLKQLLYCEGRLVREPSIVTTHPGGAQLGG